MDKYWIIITLLAIEQEGANIMVYGEYSTYKEAEKELWELSGNKTVLRAYIFSGELGKFVGFLKNQK